MEIGYAMGLLRAELYFRGARTLKDRRVHLRSLQDRLRNMGFSVAQVGPPGLVQQAWVAAALVSGSPAVVRKALDSAGRLLEDPSWELASLETDIIGEMQRLPEWETR